jgi:excisionase family DNA binding protein
MNTALNSGQERQRRGGKALARLLTEEVSVSVETAGAALGLKRSSAYSAIRTGELPHVRIGRRICVPTSALRRLLLIDS